MAEPSDSRPSRAKVPARRRSTRVAKIRPAPPGNGRPTGVRERLKRDPFLFLLCLGALAFMTWAFALTWWVTGGMVPLALAVICLAPAFVLFYLRDA